MPSDSPWGIVVVCDSESPLLAGWAPGAQPPACVLLDDEDGSWGPGQHTSLCPVGLPLWWRGRLVPEAWDRAIRMRRLSLADQQEIYDMAGVERASDARDMADALVADGALALAVVVVDEDGREIAGV